MRDLLTGLAIVVIVILTTLLVAPYFVDWNGQRGFLEAQLSKALGQTVTIGGSIDLKLLPTPYIRLNQTVIGSDEGAVRVGIHHVDLELAVAPLLHGEFDVVEGRFDEPTIRVTLQPDRTLPSLPPTPALKADIRLERIVVADGTLALADPSSGRTLVFDHLDFTAEAPTLAGPFKIAGSAGSADDRAKFRIATTEARKGRTHLHAAVGETKASPGIDLDGEVTLSAASDAVRQSFDGTATAIGHWARPDDAPVSWQLSGPLTAGPGGARMTGGLFRLGGDSGLAFKADVEAMFGETTRAAATLGAAQLDIDRLAGIATDAGTPPAPPQLPSPQSLRALIEAAIPDMPTRLDVTVDRAIWGGQPIEGLELHLDPSAEGDRLRASAEGPGGLHLALDGTLRAKASAFEGRAEVGVGDLPRALAWAGRVAQDIAPPPTILPFAAIDIAGPVAIDGYGLSSKAATLDLDRSHLTGSLRYAYGAGDKPAHLAADLVTDMLDVDALPKLRAVGRNASNLAFDIKLAARAAHVATFGHGALDAGAVSLDASGGGDRLDVRRLRVENLGGATLEASGKLAGETAVFEARVDAERLGAAAALIVQVAPGPWSDRLAARAPNLAPAHLSIDAKLVARARPGGFAPSHLRLDGTLADATLHLSLDPHDAGSTLSVHAEAPDGLSLLRELGVATAATAPIGPARVDLTASGDVEGSMESRLEAGLPGTTLSVEGKFAVLGKAHGGSGSAALKSADLGPVLRGLGLQSPDSTAPVPADVVGALAAGEVGLALSDLKGRVGATGVAGTLKIVPPSGNAPVVTGTLDCDRLALASLAAMVLGPSRAPAKGAIWSAEPFAAAAPLAPSADLALRTPHLDLAPGVAATDAAFDLHLAPGLVAISRGEAKLLGGHLDGAFTLRRDGAQATMEGSLGLRDVAANLPALGARLTGKLDFAGGGASSLALAGALAGGGAATLSDLRVPGADSGALPKVFALVEDDALSVDEEAVERALDDSARAALPAGTRRFTAGLAGGMLTLTQTEAAPSDAPVTSDIDVSLDLRARRLSVKAVETMHDLPKDWTGPPPSITVVQAGPTDAPRRRFEAVNFLNAVAARAIARESARIEAYEFDIRERSLFNTRLQADRRREQDRVKAEADARAAAEAARRAAEAARKAEAERRAEAEAARLERQREEAARQRDEAARPRVEPPADRPPDPSRFQAPPAGAATDPSAPGRY